MEDAGPAGPRVCQDGPEKPAARGDECPCFSLVSHWNFLCVEPSQVSLAEDLGSLRVPLELTGRLSICVFWILFTMFYSSQCVSL